MANEMLPVDPLKGMGDAVDDFFAKTGKVRMMPGGPQANETALADRPGTRLSRALTSGYAQARSYLSNLIDNVTGAAKRKDARAIEAQVDQAIRDLKDKPLHKIKMPTRDDFESATALTSGNPEVRQSVLEGGYNRNKARAAAGMLAAGHDNLLHKLDKTWDKAVKKFPLLKLIDKPMQWMAKRIDHLGHIKTEVGITAGAVVGATFAFAKYGTSAALPYVELGLVALAATTAGYAFLKATTPRPMTQDENAVLQRLKGVLGEEKFATFVKDNDLLVSKDGDKFYRPPEHKTKIKGQLGKEIKDRAETMDPLLFDRWLKSKELKVHPSGDGYYRTTDRPGLKFVQKLYDRLPEKLKRTIHDETTEKVMKVGATVASFGHVAVVPFSPKLLTAMVGTGAGLAFGVARKMHQMHDHRADVEQAEHHRHDHGGKSPDYETSHNTFGGGVDYSKGRGAVLRKMELKEALTRMGLKPRVYVAEVLKQRKEELRQRHSDSGSLLSKPLETGKETLSEFQARTGSGKMPKTGTDTPKPALPALNPALAKTR